MDYDKLIDAVKLCGSTPKVGQCKQCAYWAGGDMDVCIPKMTADAALAIETLRAVSREQVERVWRGEWKHYLPPLGAGDVQCRCTRCGRTPDVETPFCAWCGAPMTDKAVDIVMERLEALKDVKDD